MTIPRTRPARALRLLPLCAALAAAGCSPDLPGSGYATVTHRPEQSVPEWTHPDPPPYNAALKPGGAARVTLTNAPAGVTQAMVDEGQELYGQVCSACHGPGGVGSAAGPALNDAEWIHISGQYPEIVNIIKVGVAAPREFAGAMPPRGGGPFDDDQVNRIAAYVYALSQQGES